MPPSINALDMLRADHKHVLDLFHRYEKADEREQRSICAEALAALEAHTLLEEQVFYPFVRESTRAEELMEEASVEHATAKHLMEELRGDGRSDVHTHAVVKVLGEYVSHHVREEEERIFPLVEKLGVDLAALGETMAARQRGEADAPTAGGEVTNEVSGGGGGGGAPAIETQDDERFLAEHGADLSDSVLRAKWIHSPDEHEDHPGQTLATRSHDVIRQWAEHRKGRPCTTPGGDAQRPRVLRFNFPRYKEGLQEVSWEAWLRVFSERQLVFLYQEHMKAGNESNFFRLDSPAREDG